jgi:uncharacterized protein
LKIIGLLGTLLEAKRKGLIPSVKLLMEELVRTAGFKIHPALYQQILKIAGE